MSDFQSVLKSFLPNSFGAKEVFVATEVVVSLLPQEAKERDIQIRKSRDMEKEYFIEKTKDKKDIYILMNDTNNIRICAVPIEGTSRKSTSNSGCIIYI